MLVDWFTILAQAVNFLVLVWLLKRFLFKPIVSAMDTRQQKVLMQLRNAEEQQAGAKAEAERLRLARAELDQKKQALIREAETEADELRRRLSEGARQEVEALRVKWRDLVRAEQMALRTELADKVQREVFAICRQMLRDLATADLEEQIVAGFIGRLQKLDADERKRLATSVLLADDCAVVRSAFALPNSLRGQIESAVAALLDGAAGKPIRYEIVPDLLGGIELATDGRKIGWSIATYLSSLEESIQRSANGAKGSDEHSE
jgi:F-type H+-transporting ATPase subunit b